MGKKIKSGEKSANAEKSTKQKAKPNSLGGFAIPGQEENHIDNIARVRQNAAGEFSGSVPAQAEVMVQASNGYEAQYERMQQEEYVAPVKSVEEDDTTQIMGCYSDDGTPRLIRTSTHEIIEIDKDTFNIGKDPKALNDYILSDARVSRRHASLLYKNGQYFIVDRWSKNHTYLNGKMLVPNNEYALNSGDLIKLGPEEFTFEI